MTRTILEWEDYSMNYLPAARTKQGKKWDIYARGGTRENPTYSLSVGNIFIIHQEISSIEEAKQMAQDLQDVLDGFKPVFEFDWNLQGTPSDSIERGIEGVTEEDVDEFLKEIR